ncbi:MAG: alpha/beta fold hydrolase [Limisphaerales bacterium]
MVLLHGMFGRPADWAVVGRELRSEWRVITPHLPVFDFPHGRCGLQNLCDDLERRLDQEGIEGVVLAGNSLGGHVAVLTAARLPGRVEALVLTGSSGLHERGFERGVPRRPDRAWLRQKVEEVFYDPVHVTEELLDAVSETIGDTKTLINVVRLARAVKRSDLRNVLPRIHCPVTLIWGEDDQITPPAVAHEFARHLPGADLHFIKRCGHTPPMERPSEFYRIFRASLERLIA